MKTFIIAVRVFSRWYQGFAGVLLLFFAVHAVSAEDVSGTISANTTWTLANSPYRVTANVTVQAGVTLSIEPGVEVQSAQYRGIHVEGTISAIGTSSQPITFTGTTETPGWWGSVYVKEGGGATLDWCHFAYGGNNYYNDWGGSQLLCKSGAGALTLRNSVLRKSSNDGLRLNAGYSSLVTESNTFENNGRYGVAVGINASYVDMTSAYVSNGTAQVSLDSGSITQPVSLRIPSDYAFYAAGSITISSNASLTVGTGSVLKFARYEGLHVKGTLTAEGTESEPICFTDYRDDSVGGDTNNDGTNSVPEPGWWGSVYVKDEGGATLDWCHFAYGGNNYYNDWGGSQLLCKSGAGALTLRTSVLRQSSNDGLRLNAGYSSFVTESNTVENNGRYGVAVGINASYIDMTSAYVSNGTAQVSLDSGTITQPVSVRLPPDFAFYAAGSITISSNASLTVGTGSALKFARYKGLHVQGTLTAEGTESEPIYFTDYRDDTVGGDTNNDGTNSVPEPGWWGSVYVKDEGGATLDWCHFAYGGNNYYSDWGGSQLLCKSGAGALTLRSSVLRQSSNDGLRLNAGYSSFVTESNTVENNGRYGVAIGLGASYRDTTSTFMSNAVGQVSLDSGTLSQSMSLKLSSDYAVGIHGYITIATNGSLSVEAGTVVKCDKYKGIFVDGLLTSTGTSNEPVYFTEERDDTVGGDSNQDGTNSVPEPGWWGAIRVQNAGSATFEWTHIRYGGNHYYSVWGGAHGLVKFGDGDLHLNQSRIEQCSGNGLSVINSSGTVELVQSTFTSNTSAGVYLNNAPTVATGCTFVANGAYGLLQEVNDGIVYGDNMFEQTGSSAGVGINVGTRTSDWFWAESGSPYRIAGRFTIASNATLSIQPGTVVQGGRYQGIFVEGTLLAQGTEAKNIRFTGSTETPSWWGGLRVRNAGSATLHWCDVGYGGDNYYSYWGGNHNIYKTGSGALDIRHSTIHHSYKTGLRVDEGSSSFITASNRFCDNGQYGVYVGLNASFPDGTSDFSSNTSYNAYVQYGTITRPVVLGLKPDYSFYVQRTLTIDAAGSLTVQAGTVMKFLSYYGLLVDGLLTTTGTRENPVYFTDLRDDSVGGDANNNGTASAPVPGGWGVIRVRGSGSADLAWTHVLYAGYSTSIWSGHDGLVKSGAGDLAMSRCRIARSSGNGLNLFESSGSHTITRSLFESNKVGVTVSTQTSSLNLEGNQFISNVNYGVYCSADSAAVDARRCWWGDASGPYHPTLNTNGLANEVSDNVLFDPWRQSASMAEIIAPPRNAMLIAGDSLRFVGAPFEDDSAAYFWNFGDGRTSSNRNAGVLSFPTEGTNLVAMSLILDGTPEPLPDTRTITVIADPGTLPDLNVTSISLPPDLLPEEKCTVSYTVSNGGDGTFPDSVRRDAIYLAAASYYDTLALPVGSTQVTGSLAAGSSSNVMMDVTLPALSGGNYQLLCVVDDAWQFMDTCRLNNEEAAATARPYFFWRRASQHLFHGTVNMEWSTIGLQNTSEMVRVTSTCDETVHELASTALTHCQFSWDTTAWPDGQHLLKAAPAAGGADYPGQPFIECLVNNAVNWRGGDIYANETWTSGTVYVVESTVQIHSNVTVTIEAGAIVKFADNTGLNILNGGALLATNGAVVFTSLADDSVGGDTNLDGDESQPYPGSWIGITPQAGSTLLLDENSVLNYIRTTHSGTASVSQLWLGSYLHIVEGEYTIPSGFSLQIEPGAVIKLQTNAAIVLNEGASLTALGKVAKPIVFTTVNDDTIAGDTQVNGDATKPAAGDWKWILFNGADGLFDHCEFRYGGGPAAGGWGPSGGPGKATIKTYSSASLVMSNSVMLKSCFDGVLNWGGPAHIVNSVFTGCDRAICAHPGGVSTVINSTIDDNRTGLLIHGGKMTASNCIVANSLRAGVLRDYGSDYTTLGYNCFWNSTNFAGTADVLGTNGNFSANPSFKDRDRGVYQLQFGSPCIDAAQTDTAPPTDLMNAPRYTDPRTSPKRGVPDAEGIYADVGAYEFVENAESDLDLVISWIEGPSSMTGGEEATVRYQIINRGTAPVSGSWHDKLFLLPSLAAAGQETLDLGDALVSGTLAPEHSMVVERTVTVPYATEGEWRWQAQVNNRGEIFEGRNWVNNYSSLSAPVQLAVPRLSVGAVLTNVFAGPSSSAAVAIQQAAEQELLIRWRAEGAGQMRLYAAYDRMPTSSDYDLRTPYDDASHIRLGLAAPAVGRLVYIMALPVALTGSLQFAVSAEIPSLQLDSSLPEAIGNAGNSTLNINGAGLSTNMTLTLQPAAGSGAPIAATRLYVPDASRAYATFPLNGVATGRYHLVATDGASVTLTNAVQLNKGQGGRFIVNLLLPEAARIGRTFEATAEYANVGDADVVVPLLSIYSPSGKAPVWSGDRTYPTEAKLLQLLALPSEGAPFGVLRPGQKGSIPFFSKQESTRTAYRVEWDDETATGTVDWDAMRDAIRPADASAGWSNAFAYVAGELGYNWSNLVPALAQATAELLLPYGRVENRPYKIIDALITDRLLSDATAPFRGTLYLGTNTVILPNTRLNLTDETGNQVSTYSWIDGRFVLAELPQATYQLDVSGYIPRPVMTQVQPYQGDLEVIAQPGATLVGRVLNAELGTPVSNVLLSVRHSVENVQFTVDADESGLYRASGLIDGGYQLTASAPGWITATASVSGISAPTSLVRNLSMSRGGSASGLIRAPSGQSVSGALIQVSGNGLSTVSAESDAQGAFALSGLADGTYDLYAAAAGGGIASASNAFQISQSGSVTGLTVQLQSFAALHVTVTNADTGLAASNMTIAVAAMTEQSEPWSTDANGQCLIDAIQPGEATVWAYAPEYLPISSNITINSGTQTLHLITHSARSVALTLTLDGGTPLANTDVLIVGTNGILTEATTDSSGEIDFAGLLDGPYTILLAYGTQSAGRPIASVELSAGIPSLSTNLALSGTMLSGHVLDAASAPITNAMVSVLRDGSALAETRVTDSGAYAFLVEGTASVSVVAYAPAYGVMTQDQVQIDQTNHVADIDLMPGSGALMVSVRSAVGNAPITNLWFSCQPVQDVPDEYQWLGLTDASGVGLITNVPSTMSLHITAYGNGFALTQQLVTCTGSLSAVTLRMNPEARLQGSLVNATGGPAAQVMLVLSANNQPVPLYGMSDAYGAFSITGVAPGLWDLDVISSTVCPVHIPNIAVTGGVVSLPEVTLPDLSRMIKGSIETAGGIPVFGSSVDVLNEAGTVLLTSFSDDAGQWRIRPIPTNAFTLRVASPAGCCSTQLVTQTQPTNVYNIVLAPAQAVALNPDALSPSRGIGQSLRNFRFYSPVPVPQRIGDNVWDWQEVILPTRLNGAIATTISNP